MHGSRRGSWLLITLTSLAFVAVRFPALAEPAASSKPVPTVTPSLRWSSSDDALFRATLEEVEEKEKADRRALFTPVPLWPEEPAPSRRPGLSDSALSDSMKRAIQAQAPITRPLRTPNPEAPLPTPRRSLQEDLAVLFPLFSLAYFVFGLSGIALCRWRWTQRWVLGLIGVFVLLPLVFLLVVLAPLLAVVPAAVRVFSRFGASQRLLGKTTEERRSLMLKALSAFAVTISGIVLFRHELEEFPAVRHVFMFLEDFAALQHRVIVALGHLDLFAITSAAWRGLDKSFCMPPMAASGHCSFTPEALGHWFGSVAMTLSPSPGATLMWIAIFFWSFGVGVYFASHAEGGSFFVLMAVQVVATLMLSLLLVPLRALVQGELYAVYCALQIFLGGCGLWYIWGSATVFHGFESVRLIREKWVGVIEGFKS